jgi:glucosamine--fructose-6-phosphate aminotransferase (isomerizing)
MCGIAGYCGPRDAAGVVLEALRRLEYRGYDSAGIAAVHAGALDILKRPGKLRALESALMAHPLPGGLAIGHTRWATHGEPNKVNAHPHADASQSIAVVHNGIIENYRELRLELEAAGVRFLSETDTEVIVHLLARHYNGDLFEAMQQVVPLLHGAYAVAAVCRHEPGLLVGVRCKSPLVIGVGEGEAFLASDPTALLPFTREVVYLDEGCVCAVRADGVRVVHADGTVAAWTVETIPWSAAAAEKGGYPHFMLKEIHEQPAALRNTGRGRVGEGSAHVRLEDLHLTPAEAVGCGKLIIAACGTAYHAGLVGKYLIEACAGIPVEVEFASEFRYRLAVVPPGTIFLAISQSGETADTLEALRLAKAQGARTLAIVNTVGSSVAREADGVVYQQAGPEISVASTKAYTSQCAALVLLAVWLGQARGALDPARAAVLLEEFRALPDQMEQALAQEPAIHALANTPLYVGAASALYLGRNINYATALEGALKLKEISYVHAEGCPAGEMKHGPIALIAPDAPTIALAPMGITHDKMLSNMHEIRARKGPVLAIATAGDEAVWSAADAVIYIPACDELLSPILAAAPLQLLAYHVAVARGCDVDQPRNLAKSVTVE